MDIHIEIDDNSGFCFGVTTAIKKAEEELRQHTGLYCLGDIVHNDKECERLHQMGLEAINHETYGKLHHAKVLLRAHGEPPQTYATARRNDIDIIDATCPVVLQLQKRIKKVYDTSGEGCQIAIFGKHGHAEVLGLVGQTQGKALVLDTLEDAGQLDFSRDIRLFSQTTKPLEDFKRMVRYIEEHIQPPATFQYFDTICRQVSHRMTRLQKFATIHDAILFVSGMKSSNGRALFEACRAVNPNAHLVEGPEDIDFGWFHNVSTLGICGATSTPKWLMEACKEAILQARNEPESPAKP